MTTSKPIQNETKSQNVTNEGITVKLNREDPESNFYNLDKEISNWKECINSTKKWTTKSNPGGLITIYIEEPGTSAEIFGPNSNESRKALEEVDKFIGNLTKSLDMEETDLIILSTPGFLEVSTTTEKVINLDKIRESMEKDEQESYLTIGTTPVISIKPTKGNLYLIQLFVLIIRRKNIDIIKVDTKKTCIFILFFIK